MRPAVFTIKDKKKLSIPPTAFCIESVDGKVLLFELGVENLKGGRWELDCTFDEALAEQTAAMRDTMTVNIKIGGDMEKFIEAIQVENNERMEYQKKEC